MWQMPVHWNVVSGEMAKMNVLGKYECERCCFGLFGMGKVLGYKITACEEQCHGPRHGPFGLISLFLLLSLLL